jgi:DNA-binding winged helix-turn-helix (wHTH) protein/Tfp pilus assembly protein PilF
VESSGEYRFDHWTFRERSGELLSAGRPVHLRHQSQIVLRELLRQPGELVTRATLIAKLWPRGSVDYETALNSAVRRLRGTLGDQAETPRYVETVPKRGYRFIGRLEESAAGIGTVARIEPVARIETVTPPVAVRRSPFRVAAALLALAGAAAVVAGSSRFDPGDWLPANAAESGAAHEDYLLGKHFYRKRTPADLVLARRHFEQALAAEPNHAGAWAGLASVHWIDTVEGRVPASEGLPRVRAAAERALAIDAASVEAHLRLAGYHWRSGESAQGDQHYELAVSLEPGNPLALSITAGIAASDGRLDEAVALQRRSVEGDPLLVPSRWNLVTWLYLAGRWAEAEDEILQLRELVPADGEVPVRLADLAILRHRYAEALDLTREMTRETDRLFARALAFHGLGRKAESDAALEALFELLDESEAFRIVEALAFRGEGERAFAWLRASHSDLDDPWIRYSPFLRTLQADPRWAAWLDAARHPPAEPVATRRKS